MDSFDLYLRAVQELAALDHEITELEKEILKFNPDYQYSSFKPEHAVSWWWSVDLITNIASWDEIGREVLDIGSGGSMDYDKFISRLYPEDAEILKASKKRFLNGDQSENITLYRIYIKNKIKVVRSTGSLIKCGKNLRVVGNSELITKESLIAKILCNDFDLFGIENYLQSVIKLTGRIKKGGKP